MSTQLRYTIHHLEGLPEDDGNRYEIIDGELYVTTQPSLGHQGTVSRITIDLGIWNKRTDAGHIYGAPGVIFAEDDAVAPDLVWVRRDRLRRIAGDDGKLHAAPDLVVEVLSPGKKNQTRDRDLKLRLYSRQGVQEYWIVNWREPSIAIYRRQDAVLQLVATLRAGETLTSPLLPGFTARVDDLCSTEVHEAS